MSGHSKWATIKHKKAAKDARKGKVFTKIIRELTVAARQGGGDLDGNPRLRNLVTKAKQAGMPMDNIGRAIKKGTGELEGETLEEVAYEGYGPGGVALLIDTVTDNRQRTVMEVRHLLERNGGKLGSTGCVSYLFHTKGLFVFSTGATTEDDLMERFLDKGIEDIKATEEGDLEVTCDPGSFETLKTAFDAASLRYEVGEVSRLPSTTVRLAGDDGRKVLRLVEALEDHDDVQKVFSNFDVPRDVLEEFEAEA